MSHTYSPLLRSSVVLALAMSSMALFVPAQADAPLTTLVNFTGSSGAAKGATPEAGLIQIGNTFYGTTRGGGGSGNKALGTIFKLDATTNAFTSMASFTGTSGAVLGSVPVADLLSDGAGNLYGTTNGGGSKSNGTIFKINTTTNAFTSVVSFTGTTGAARGSSPRGTLITNGSGTFYGTTFDGGTLGNNSGGTVFSLTGSTITTLATFNFNNTFGPSAALYRDASGNLFGTTQGDGFNNLGTVFKVAAGTNALSTLVTFTGPNGALPYSTLIPDSLGNLYGMTSGDATNNVGTIFKINPTTKAFTTLATFTGANGDSPEASLLDDGHGNFYGTTYQGGINNAGTIFKYNLAYNSLTTLFNFDGTNGSNPNGNLITDGKGRFYGTTEQGGTGGNGTVFALLDVPEPSSVAALGIGIIFLSGFVFTRRKRIAA